MSDASLSNVLSFLDIEDLVSVVEQVRAERGTRTKRSERDGQMFLFAAPEGEPQPTEVIWLDIAADFDPQSVEVFADRCEDRGLDGTILTTGDEVRARETLALAFATDEQLEEQDYGREELELIVDPSEVEVPLSLETMDDLEAALLATGLDDEVIDEHYESHEPDFEEVLREIDEEEAMQEVDDEQESSSGLGLLVLLLVFVLAVAVGLFLFGPF
ncbi:hypothetical protein [Haloferax mucosum]|nr:hypothetical protein [Haloferax mucosum]